MSDLFADQTDIVSLQDDDYLEYACYPWMELMDYNRLEQPFSAIRLLQRKVTCFVQYVEPPKIEIKLREYLVHRIRISVQAEWPSATVDVFGSSSTSLYLPNSAINLVVQVPSHDPPRPRILARTIAKDGICLNTPVIENTASGPVVEFKDSMTNLKGDIILDLTSGLGE